MIILSVQEVLTHFYYKLDQNLWAIKEEEWNEKKEEEKRALCNKIKSWKCPLIENVNRYSVIWIIKLGCFLSCILCFLAITFHLEPLNYTLGSIWTLTTNLADHLWTMICHSLSHFLTNDFFALYSLYT